MASQSQKKLKRLVEKAEELFWKYGYNAVSMDQIANEAGISKMTIYKHFHSKDDLFIETLINNTIYHMDIVMKEISREYHTLEKIESMYAYMLTVSKDLPANLIKDVMERPYVLEKIMEFKQKKVKAMWQYILEDGIKKGEIRPLNVEFVSHLLLNLPLAFMQPDYLYEEKGRQWLYENFFDFMKYGLLGGEGYGKNHSNESGRYKQELPNG